MLRRKKRHFVRMIVIFALLLCTSAAYICNGQIKEFMANKAANIVAEKLLETQIKSNGLSKEINVKDVMKHVDKKDIDTVTNIVKDSMTSETVKEATGYIKNKDMSGLKQYMENQLNDVQKQQVRQIYEKYKNQIP